MENRKCFMSNVFICISKDVSYICNTAALYLHFTYILTMLFNVSHNCISVCRDIMLGVKKLVEDTSL